MSDESSEAVAGLAGKYLTFFLGGEVYGVQILKVQEIIGMERVTGVPNTPHYVRGVINLRGQVIPVIDLRLRFELEAKEDTERTCIVVVQVANGDEMIVMGIIVDEVQEVLEIAAEQLAPPPQLGSDSSDFILGIGKIKKAVIMLLDIDKVLTGAEVLAMEEISKGA